MSFAIASASSGASDESRLRSRARQRAVHCAVSGTGLPGQGGGVFELMVSDRLERFDEKRVEARIECAVAVFDAPVTGERDKAGLLA